MEEMLTSGEWQRQLEPYPQPVALQQRIERQVDIPGAVQILANWLNVSADSFVKASASR